MEKEVQILCRPGRDLLPCNLTVEAVDVLGGGVKKTSGEDTGSYNIRDRRKSGNFHRHRFTETRPKFQRESDWLLRQVYQLPQKTRERLTFDRLLWSNRVHRNVVPLAI